MLGVLFADNIKFAGTLHDLAIGAHFFDGASYFHKWWEGTLQPTHDPAPRPVGAQFEKHAIAGHDTDVVHFHLTGEMRKHLFVEFFYFNPERQPRQGFQNNPFFRGFHQEQEKTRLVLMAKAMEAL